MPVNLNSILVDDGSSDQTWNMMKQMSKKYNVKAIKLARNFRKEIALTAGLSKTNSDAVIFLDMDLQHPTNIIPKMMRNLVLQK